MLQNEYEKLRYQDIKISRYADPKGGKEKYDESKCRRLTEACQGT